MLAAHATAVRNRAVPGANTQAIIWLLATRRRAPMISLRPSKPGQRPSRPVALIGTANRSWRAWAGSP